MTRRKRAVLALIVVQLVILLLGLLLQIFGLAWLSYLFVAASVLVLTLAAAGIWRRLASHHAALQEEVRALGERRGASPTGRPERPKASSSASSDFLVGRAAGVRQPVTTSYVEQERLLFGQHARWTTLTEEDLRISTIAVIGSRNRYDRALPPEWAADLELLPGIMEAQAEQREPSVVLCDSSVFSVSPWREAVDAAGTWIVQDMQRLRAWADARGALLVFFDQEELPLGVNTATILSFFHLCVAGEPPASGPEGAPVPAAIRELHRLAGLLAEQKTEA